MDGPPAADLDLLAALRRIEELLADVCQHPDPHDREAWPEVDGTYPRRQLTAALETCRVELEGHAERKAT